MPTLRRLSLGSLPAASGRWLRAKTVICGDSTPSVPPDMTKAILASTSRGASLRRGDSALHKAATAYSRVKSFTPPLPSVLPKTARMDEGSSAPLSISAMRPETSPGPLVGMRVTSNEFGCIGPSAVSAEQDYQDPFRPARARTAAESFRLDRGAFAPRYADHCELSHGIGARHRRRPLRDSAFRLSGAPRAHDWSAPQRASLGGSDRRSRTPHRAGEK